jgi:hypothetical protein
MLFPTLCSIGELLALAEPKEKVSDACASTSMPLGCARHAPKVLILSHHTPVSLQNIKLFCYLNMSNIYIEGKTGYLVDRSSY